MCTWLLEAQEVTIINNFPSEGASRQAEDYVLKKVTEHTYIVNEYEPSQSSQYAQVMQLISYSLRSYADNQYYSTRNNVMGLEDGKAFATAAAGIVRNALWIHDYAFHEEFVEFSKEVSLAASQLYALSGYSSNTVQGSGISQKSKTVELYYFQRMVYDLKMKMERDVAVFLKKKSVGGVASVDDPSNENESTAPQLPPLDSYIEPLPDVGQALEDLKPSLPVDFGRPVADNQRRRRRSDRSSEFSEKMVRLLEENNRILSNYGGRFENLQSQIEDERAQRNEGLELVREEMKALRELIKLTLTSPPMGVAAPTSAAASVVETVFEKNSSELTSAHHAILNRAVITLLSNPNANALIVGYADRSGNSVLNARLSERRAMAVREYLLGQGIAASRMQVTYVGDASSEGANPADRKVEVRVL